mmetsp:Transcript_1799/g.7865  ORF Transcript_1799/g.7865 Transcript_1799/m.7865 type:complete len:279 (-) Transcript_1799:44-880(-)
MQHMVPARRTRATTPPSLFSLFVILFGCALGTLLLIDGGKLDGARHLRRHRVDALRQPLGHALDVDGDALDKLLLGRHLRRRFHGLRIQELALHRPAADSVRVLLSGALDPRLHDLHRLLHVLFIAEEPEVGRAQEIIHRVELLDLGHRAPHEGVLHDAASRALRQRRAKLVDLPHGDPVALDGEDQQGALQLLLNNSYCLLLASPRRRLAMSAAHVQALGPTPRSVVQPPRSKGCDDAQKSENQDGLHGALDWQRWRFSLGLSALLQAPESLVGVQR